VKITNGMLVTARSTMFFHQLGSRILYLKTCSQQTYFELRRNGKNAQRKVLQWPSHLVLEQGKECFSSL